MKITCCAAAVCCCNSANSLKSSFKLIEDDELVLTDSVDENLIIGLNPGEYGDEGAWDKGDAEGTYLGGLSIW